MLSHESQKLIEKADVLIEMNRAAEALPLLLKALAEDPQNAYAVCSVARCQYELEQYEEAREQAEKAISISPDYEWGHRLRSIILLQLNKNKESLASALTAAKITPDEPNVLQTLAYAQIACEKYDEAKTTAKKLLEIEPDTEDTHLTAGSVYLSAQEYYLAEKHFQEALRINPTSYNARNNLGVMNLQQKIGDEYVIDDFTEAVKLDPSNSLAIDNLRIQFSILPQLAVYIMLIPIILMGLLIAPVISVILFIGGSFQIIKTLVVNFNNRNLLAKEFRILFKSEGYKKRLGRSAKFFWEMCRFFFQKLWLVYLLAFAALTLRFIAHSNDSNLLGALAFLVFLACPFLIYKKFTE